MCKSGKYGELYEKYAAVADGLSLKYLEYVNVWAYWCFFLYLHRSDFPVVAFGVDKKRRQVPQFILRLHYWSILFFAYILFTASSYILSRNIMLFKMFGILYFTYALFSCRLGKYTQRLVSVLCLLVSLSGPLSMWLGLEYKVLNPKVFYSNNVDLLNVSCRLEGY